MDDQEKFSIVLFSGTVDKLVAAVTLATGAAVMGKEVNIFLTYWGVVAFRAGTTGKPTAASAKISRITLAQPSKPWKLKACPPMETLQAQWNWVMSL